MNDRHLTVDGTWMHLPPMDLLCGSTASFDDSSGCSYRCDYCGATVGSISMPRRCKELYEMEDVVAKLKGKKYADTNI